jgi:hypothetical protein
MWLNVLIMGFSCLFVGFILGWVMGRPRRWDRYIVSGISAGISGGSSSGSSSEAARFPARPTEHLASLPPTLTTRG